MTFHSLYSAIRAPGAARVTASLYRVRLCPPAMSFRTLPEQVRRVIHVSFGETPTSPFLRDRLHLFEGKSCFRHRASQSSLSTTSAVHFLFYIAMIHVSAGARRSLESVMRMCSRNLMLRALLLTLSSCGGGSSPSGPSSASSPSPFFTRHVVRKHPLHRWTRNHDLVIGAERHHRHGNDERQPKL